jgi:hypothetical protein
MDSQRQAGCDEETAQASGAGRGSGSAAAAEWRVDQSAEEKKGGMDSESSAAQ